MKKIPKRAKFIADGGFVRYGEVKPFVPRVAFPLLNGHVIEFEFDHVSKTMVVYKERQRISGIGSQNFKVLKNLKFCPTCHADLPPR